MAEPATKPMKASEVREQWSQVLNRVFRREARILVEKSGIPVAAIISAADLEQLQRLEMRRQADFRVLFETQQAFKDVPDDELERQIERAIAEARESKRQSDDAATA